MRGATWSAKRMLHARLLTASALSNLSRTVAVLNKKGIPVHCLARAVTQKDFRTFDYILGM